MREQDYGVDAPGGGRLVNPGGSGHALLVCEHASNHVPAEFDGLGLDAAARASHIAWDPGALGVAERLSDALDAQLLASRVSRLVYDCNRPPQAPDAIPARSEIHDIPGNAGLDAATRQDRIDRFYRPFEARLAALVAARPAPPVLITVHSFTPVYKGKSRSVELGILHDSDARLANAILDRAADFTGLAVERNAPYGPADGVTHTLLRHAVENGLMNVMLEIRSDLIADPGAQADMAAMLARLLGAAMAALDVPPRTEATA
ncbi:N-formylglutamate amidohydrolase [Maritimibacter sp. 55A14]|nr:N-formylglutamate amidohydrolase [Maritimibacter sp. 55A14]